MSLQTVGLNVVVRGATQAASQVRSLGSALNQVVRDSGGIGGVLSRLASPITNIGNLLKTISGHVVRFGRSMTSAGSVISTVGFRMSALIGLPIIAFFKGTVDAATSFEDALAKMVTLVGIGGDEVSRLGKEILQVAPSLGTTPVELAGAAYFVLSNHIRDTSLAMEVVTASAKASAIGMGSTENIARILTAAMVAYGKENLSASRAADQLVAAVQRGAVEADEFAEPLGRMLGLAANLGVSFGEATSFITTFTAGGNSASEAVTGLNRTMASFINPTREAQDALAKIGLTAVTARELLAEKGLSGTLLELRERFDAAGVPLSDFIGRLTGLNAVLFNTGEAAQEYVNTVDIVNKANGTLDRSFQVVTGTTSFQFAQLKASLQVLAITIGAILLPAINTIIQRLLPLVEAIRQFAETHPRIILVAAALGLVAVVLGPVVTGLGLMVSSIGILISAVGTLAGLIGSLLAPTFGTLIAVLTLAWVTVRALYLGSLKKMREDMDTSFEGLTQRAFAWGKNMIISLARGIAAAAIAVINALIYIGRIITGWLKGASPPKLLPDLEKWGANVINTFLHGFTLADFDVFNELAGVIENLFTSLEGQGLKEKGVIPAILGSRAAIAEAIKQISTVGMVTDDVLARISGSFGQVSEDVRQYVLVLADLKRASEEVAAAEADIEQINRDFEDAVKPLNKELGQIANRFDEIKTAQEKQRLQAILKDPRAPQLAKELAMLSLRELELKGQIKTEEQQRDVALEAANARLEAAQAEQEALKQQAELLRAIIDAQIENQNLTQRQIQLLARLADKLDEAKKAAEETGGGAGGAIDELGGLGPGGGTGLTPEGIIPEDLTLPSLADIIGEGLAGAAADVQRQIEEIFGEVQGIFDPVIEKLDALTTVWAELFTLLGQNKGKVADFAEELAAVGAVIAGTKLVFWVATIVSTVRNFIAGLSLAGGAVTIFGFAVGGPFIIALLAAILALGALIIKFGGLKGAADAIREVWTGSGTFGPNGPVRIGMRRIRQAFIEWFADLGAKFKEWALNIGETVSTWASDTGTAIGDWVTDRSQDFADWVDETIENVTTWANDTKTSIETWVTDTSTSFQTWVSNIVGSISDAITQFGEKVTDWFNAGAALMDGLIDGVLSKLQSMIQTVLDIANEIWDAWNKFWDEHSPSQRMFDSALNIMQGFLDGMKASLPELTSTMADVGAVGSQAFISGTAGMASAGANVTFGPTYINNGMDQAVFEARVRRIITESIR